MLPAIHIAPNIDSPNRRKQKWKRTSRRISNANLLPIIKKNPKSQTFLSPEEAIPDDPVHPERNDQSFKLPVIQPSLCIDNAYFKYYQEEEEEESSRDGTDMDKILNGFNSFCRIHSDWEAKRDRLRNLRGIAAIVNKYTSKYEETVNEQSNTISVCKNICDTFSSNVEVSYELFIEEFCQNAFKLACINSKIEKKLRKTGSKREEERLLNEQIDTLQWKINEEKRRINKLDKIIKDNENKDET